jgi:hypothetical protein
MHLEEAGLGARPARAQLAAETLQGGERPLIGALAMALFAAAGTPGEPSGRGVEWLVVAASDPSPAGIAKKAKALAAKTPGALVFQTKDCGEKRNVFGVAAEILDSTDGANAALQRARGVIKDAYVKRCVVVPGSLLALRFPAVDSSIASVPDDAVNWDDSDRISTAIKLPDGRNAIAQRVFVDDPEDQMEGRRVRVLVVTGPGKGKVLTDDCTSPQRFKVSDGLLAFQCDGSEAGDQLLHDVLVFDTEGKQLAKVTSCRNPALSDASAVVCSEESVDAKGRLKFHPKRVSLVRTKAATPQAPP